MTNSVVDRWEELAHVTTQRVAILTSKVLAAVQGAMGAFAHPVGVAVVDETPLKDGFDIFSYDSEHGCAGCNGFDICPKEICYIRYPTP